MFMTYQRNIDLPQEDVLDEVPERLIRHPEVEADDHAGDQDDGHALDHLGLVRPLALLQLADRLGDEALAAASGDTSPARLALDGLLRRADLRLPRPGALAQAAAAGSLPAASCGASCGAPRAALR